MKAANSTGSRIPAPIVFKWLMIISGVMFLTAFVTLPACFRRANSKHWPTADGMIVAAGLKTNLGKSHIQPSYEPFVCFTFDVEGIPRVSTKISFADSPPIFSKEDGLAWLAQNYPRGKRVAVYYDPHIPDLAVLQPGARDLVFIWMFWLGATAFCGVAAWLGDRLAMRRLNPSVLAIKFL